MKNQRQDMAVVESLKDTGDPEGSSTSDQLILGEKLNTDRHETHSLFIEILELITEEETMQWQERARWVKYEEKVEEGGRWSKPYLSTLPLHYFFELRSLIMGGTIILNMEASNMMQVVDFIIDSMINNNSLGADEKKQVREALLKRHIHQHQKKIDGPIISFLSVIETCRRSEKNVTDHSSNESTHRDEEQNDQQHSISFLKKIPRDAEACNILIGGVHFLLKPITFLVRLKSATVMENLTEVPVPTRFIFLLLGPSSSSEEYYEIGRVMATLMSDDIFHEVAYRAKNCSHLLAGLEEFLNAATVLPPGKWNPITRIEPQVDSSSHDTRRKPTEKTVQEAEREDHEEKLRQESGLVRTGVLFGGLISDIKKKIPWYWSDFQGACSTQCIASWIFLYFACLSPIITFGGLLSRATAKNMAAMESLVAGFVCGMFFGLFSGQPLTILASTGPVLVFETIVYNYCETIGWDYMSFRFCIGTWIAVILMILVALDASAFVCYITRFTEDNFASLVAVIFIYEALQNVLLINTNFPIGSTVNTNLSYECSLLSNVSTESNHSIITNEESTHKIVGLDRSSSDGRSTTFYVADVFLMSVLLFLGTYVISMKLKNFKSSPFFSSKVRQLISDFAVTIAILSMTVLDSYMAIPTPKLEVPTEFKPTSTERGWLIPPFKNNPISSLFVAIPPALLGTILIFMDQQITAVIVNRKQHKLKKGCGYHLDLFVLSLLIAICSFLGLPWFVAATVPSINHVNSLKLESESAAPGEKQKFLGVREQRVTHILIFLTIGLSVFLTPILGYIPMPVLYGIFLFMGVESLKGLELFDRILIIFMPKKYQPDYKFLRQVPIARVHLFTVIQLACLICLWTVKSFSSTSILFPLMLVVMIFVRKFLNLIFTQRELMILDDILPTRTNKKQTFEDGRQSFTSKFSHFVLGPKLKKARRNDDEMCS